tara:strand:- start:2297 stop:2512 length:216 start_codon:yes stop_codon:yes gene_type:complete
MLKVKNGTVIEGIFSDNQYIKIVKNSDFSTLIIHIDIKQFDVKCMEVVSALADEGIQYATDYVIARAANES